MDPKPTDPPNPPAPVENPPAAPPAAAEDVIHLRKDALDAKLREEGQRAARAERNALEERVRQAGFKGLDDAMQVLTRPPAPPAPGDPADPAARNPEPVKPPAEWQREYDKQSRLLEQERQRADAARAESVQMRQQFEAAQARSELEKLAISTGVQDVDYALSLLQRELAGKTDSELDQFDERAFFGKLKQSRPYLFGTTIVPATTGTGADPAPKPPGAADAAARAAEAANERQKVLRMTPQQFAEYVRTRGIDPARA